MSEEYTWFKESGLLSGLWKFSPNVSASVLMKLAEKWKADHPEYEKLYVRGSGKNGALGIGYEYRIPEGHKSQPVERSADEFFYDMTDRLKRQFGNDFTGFDVCLSGTYVMKKAAS